MPQLMTSDDLQTMQIPGQGGFYFSGVKADKLGATEYTLVTVVIDVTGSVENFADGLLKTLQTIIAACQKNPRSENLMVRVITFNEDIKEIHGFVPLSEINPKDYQPFEPRGMTNLHGATYSGIGATLEYAKILMDQDFDVNGCVYIITDGVHNSGSITASQVADKMKKAKIGEEIESLVAILIGLKDPKITGDEWADTVQGALTKFEVDAELTQYVEVGDATPQKLAKLANWVSKSISSQSQSLGSGAASQPLSF